MWPDSEVGNRRRELLPAPPPFPLFPHPTTPSQPPQNGRITGERHPWQLSPWRHSSVGGNSLLSTLEVLYGTLRDICLGNPSVFDWALMYVRITSKKILPYLTLVTLSTGIQNSCINCQPHVLRYYKNFLLVI